MKKLTDEQIKVMAEGFSTGFEETEKEAAAEGYSMESVIKIYEFLKTKIEDRLKVLRKQN